MTTMTMPTTVERIEQKPVRPVSHLTPFLLAMVFLVTAGVISLLVSGPLH